LVLSRLELGFDPGDVEVDGGVDAGDALGGDVVAGEGAEGGHATQVHDVSGSLEQWSSIAADASIGTCSNDDKNIKELSVNDVTGKCVTSHKG
jgi:hypothetical protein